MTTKLVQIKLPADIKDKLDKIFSKDGTSTPQGLKMIATQIANNGFSPFTSIYYETYSHNIRDDLKEDLHQEQLKMLRIIPDDSETFTDETALRKALDERLGK